MPEQNCRYFADDILKLFVQRKKCILIQFPAQFVSERPINNK